MTDPWVVPEETPPEDQRVRQWFYVDVRDAELNAMNVAKQVIEQLDLETQKRVVRWLMARYAKEPVMSIQGSGS